MLIFPWPIFRLSKDLGFHFVSLWINYNVFRAVLAKDLVIPWYHCILKRMIGIYDITMPYIIFNFVLLLSFQVNFHFAASWCCISSTISNNHVSSKIPPKLFFVLAQELESLFFLFYSTLVSLKNYWLCVITMSFPWLLVKYTMSLRF